MADSLTFTFSLDDKTSGPLSKMISAMERFSKGTENAGKSVDESFKGVGKSLDEVSEKMNKLSEFVGLGLLLEGFKKVGEMVEGIFDRMREFGSEVLHIADFSRTTKISLEALTGSAEAAEKVFAGAKAFALEAGTPLKATVDAYRELTLAGVQVQNLPKVLQAASDLSILKTGTTDQMGTFADMLGKIQSKGEATSMEFRQLKGLLDFKALAKNLGVASVMDLTKDSAVSANKAIGAILKTLQGMEHGVLGNVTKQVGDGWAGSIEKVKTQWDLLLESFESTGAFNVVLDFMRTLTKSLGPGGELGPVLRETFTELFTSIGDGLKELSKPGRLKNLILEAKEFLTALSSIVIAIGHVVNGVATIGGMLLSDDKKTKEVGKDITKGIAFGILQSASDPVFAITKMLSLMLGGADKKLERHSPSRVMMRMGEDTVEGFELGLGESKLENSIKMRLPDRVPGASVSHGGVTIHQEIHVAGGSMDVEELAHRVAQVSVTDLTSALETLGLSAGAYGG